MQYSQRRLDAMKVKAKNIIHKRLQKYAVICQTVKLSHTEEHKLEKNVLKRS